jgi:probable rRNA maturation factor
MSAKEIIFFSHEVKTRTLHKEKIKEWLDKTAVGYKRKIGSLHIIFCSDEFLRKMNKEYLKHDYYTDIITFHYGEQKKTLAGELYISIDRVRENAGNLHINTEQEKRRVIIHGLLHLLDFNDEKSEEKERMTSLENKYLHDFERMLNNSST